MTALVERGERHRPSFEQPRVPLGDIVPRPPQMTGFIVCRAPMHLFPRGQEMLEDAAKRAGKSVEQYKRDYKPHPLHGDVPQVYVQYDVGTTNARYRLGRESMEITPHLLMFDFMTAHQHRAAEIKWNVKVMLHDQKDPDQYTLYERMHDLVCAAKDACDDRDHPKVNDLRPKLGNLGADEKANWEGEAAFALHGMSRSPSSSHSKSQSPQSKPPSSPFQSLHSGHYLSPSTSHIGQQLSPPRHLSSPVFPPLDTITEREDEPNDLWIPSTYADEEAVSLTMTASHYSYPPPTSPYAPLILSPSLTSSPRRGTPRAH